MLTAVFGIALTAQAQTYRVTDLGVFPGQTISKPAGINNAGQVAGSSGPHAIRFSNGAVEDLGTLPGGNLSVAIAINDLGQVVGDSQFQDGGAIRHATLFSNGTVTDLGYLPLSGNYSRGTGINEAGEVVGYSGPSFSTSNSRAFIWDASHGMGDLGTLGGQYAKASSINNSSVVTGTSQVPTGFGNFHAFVWTAATGMVDIGTIAGDSSGGAFINDNGHVAGSSTINDFDNRSHAFLYDGTMHDLGAIGDNDFYSDRSSATGINIHDQVVGTTYRPYQGGGLYQIAFVYRDGQMLDLEALADASGAFYRLYTATGINDAGQIAVDAIKISTNEIHAVLLTPNDASTPTPTPTPVATATPTPSLTPTPTPVATATPTPASTATPTPTPGSTLTPTPTPAATSTPTATTTPAPRPVNIATRGRVQTGDNAMIGGFIITGSESKKVIVRAIGPSLQQFGLSDLLADPILELHGSDGSLLYTNDNWKDDPAQRSSIEASHLSPGNDLESAIAANLPPGSYTAVVRGKNGATGVGVVEVFDLDGAAKAALANISTRSLVQSADSVMIGGFILGSGSGTTKVLVRALGPSLANLGISNSLPDPTLELRDENGALLRSDDNWKDKQAREIEATNLQPKDNLDAAIVADLPSGAYTAIVAGKDAAAGVGLIEVYNLP
jgi:probable HAF family extracellular repeat protein